METRWQYSSYVFLQLIEHYLFYFQMTDMPVKV